MNIIIALKLLIIKCITEKRDIFHIYNLIVNLDIKFIHKIYFNYEFNEFENYQQLNFIEKALNKDCFENFIIKVVMLDSNV